MDLSPRHLRFLTLLADTGSETEAAAVLGTSQPAVSLQLRRLEQRIGAALFERQARGLRLTSDGERVVAMARNLLEGWAELDAEIDRIRLRVTGRFAVCLVAYGAGNHTSDIVRRFQEAWPQLSVSVTQADLGSRIEPLLDGTCDVMLTLGPINDPRVEKELLFEDPVVAAVHSESSFAGREFVDISELLDEPFIVAPEATEALDREWHAFWRADHARHGRAVRVGGRYASPEMHLNAVAMGQGIALVTARTFDLYRVPSVAVVPVLGMSPVPHWVAWRRDSALLELTRSFVDIARAAVSHQAARGRGPESAGPHGIAAS